MAVMTAIEAIIAPGKAYPGTATTTGTTTGRVMTLGTTGATGPIGPTATFAREAITTATAIAVMTAADTPAKVLAQMPEGGMLTRPGRMIGEGSPTGVVIEDVDGSVHAAALDPVPVTTLRKG